MIEVTVRDTETGETETGTIEDDYILVVAGTCYRAHVNAHANGTHVITVKGRRVRPNELDLGVVVDGAPS